MNHKFRTYEDFQDSTSYLKQKSPRFLKIFIWSVVIILIILVISLFFIKKTNYIEGVAILSPKEEPKNIIAPENGIIKNIKIKQSSEVNKNNIIIELDSKNDKTVQEDYVINKNQNKINDLQTVSDNINSYPNVYKVINNNNNVKKFEFFKAKYAEITRERWSQSQVELLKKEYQQEISEKIESLTDEIDSIKLTKQNSLTNIKALQAGKLNIAENIKEGLEVRKGEILFQIYQKQPKSIKMQVTDTEMSYLKTGLKVNLKFKGGNTTIKTKGKVSNLAYFPDTNHNSQNSKQITYTVTIDINQQKIRSFDNIAVSSGEAYIEIGKETLAEYLYKKIKH